MPDPQDSQPEDARPPSDPGAQEAPVERTGRIQEVTGEDRAFDGKDETAPRDAPVSPAEGRLGPAADPAEGKR